MSDKNLLISKSDLFCRSAAFTYAKLIVMDRAICIWLHEYYMPCSHININVYVVKGQYIILCKELFSTFDFQIPNITHYAILYGAQNQHILIPVASSAAVLSELLLPEGYSQSVHGVIASAHQVIAVVTLI